jgi:uncharacterized BrkB/YihY/UPF0761 family membrane protein
MVEIAKQILDYLIANYALYMVVTMSIIISLTISILSVIKKPIKKLTAKIPNERVRKLANKTFVILAFVFSGLSWISLHFIAPSYFDLNTVQILLTGAFAVVLYALADGVVTKSKAQQIVETIADYAEDKENKAEQEKKDNKATKENADPIEEFWKQVK